MPRACGQQPRCEGGQAPGALGHQGQSPVQATASFFRSAFASEFSRSGNRTNFSTHNCLIWKKLKKEETEERGKKINQEKNSLPRQEGVRRKPGQVTQNRCSRRSSAGRNIGVTAPRIRLQERLI